MKLLLTAKNCPDSQDFTSLLKDMKQLVADASRFIIGEGKQNISNKAEKLQLEI